MKIKRKAIVAGSLISLAIFATSALSSATHHGDSKLREEIYHTIMDLQPELKGSYTYENETHVVKIIAKKTKEKGFNHYLNMTITNKKTGDSVCIEDWAYVSIDGILKDFGDIDFISINKRILPLKYINNSHEKRMDEILRIIKPDLYKFKKEVYDELNRAWNSATKIK